MADPVEDATTALRGESTVRGLLETACRELTEALDASACLISRVVGDLLVSLAEFSRGERAPGIGHEYLISDYPLTHEVIVGGEPRSPYAMSDGQISFAFPPTFIICTPSVQHGITPLSGNVTGSPRSTELSKVSPLVSLPV